MRSCGTPNAGEGENLEPQKGRLPGCGASCEGMLSLADCRDACEKTPRCDAISWESSTRECYLKSNPTACATVASGTMCPWNADRGAGWQYHMHCSCAIPGHFPSGEDGLPKVECGSWGWGFVGAVLVVAILYVGSGVAYNFKRGRRELLPHAIFWRELGARPDLHALCSVLCSSCAAHRLCASTVGGLCMDGVAFSRGQRGGAPPSGLKEPLPTVQEETDSAAGQPKAASSPDVAGGGQADEEEDDEEIIE